MLSGTPIRAAARATGAGDVDLSLLQRFELDRVILLGLPGGDGPIDRIGVAARPDDAADADLRDVRGVLAGKFLEEGDRLTVGVRQAVARIPEKRAPVRAGAVIKAAQERRHAMTGDDIEIPAEHSLHRRHGFGVVEQRKHRELRQLETPLVQDFGFGPAFRQKLHPDAPFGECGSSNHGLLQ